MPRGRFGLFGTKRLKTIDIEDDEFIAQLFEQESDFLDDFDTYADFADDFSSPDSIDHTAGSTSDSANHPATTKRASASASTSNRTASTSKPTSQPASKPSTSPVSNSAKPRQKSNQTSPKNTKKSKSSQPNTAPQVDRPSQPNKSLKPAKPRRSNKSPRLKASPRKPTAAPTLVHTYDEIVAALSAKCPYIVLADNILTSDNLLINHDVTIDFNGFSIISNDSRRSVRVLDIRRGAVHLTGKGKIFALGQQGIAVRLFAAISNNSPDYTTVTIDQGINLFAPEAYGILISPNLGAAYGLTLHFAGQIFAHDGICLAGAIRANDRNLPAINVSNTANIVADETAGVAIEAAGYGKWKIDHARLSGAAVASLSGGELTFTSPQAIAKDITFSLCPSDAQALKVTLDGGTYIAERGTNIAGEQTPSTKFTIKSGDFYASVPHITEHLQPLVQVKAGTNFIDHVSEILAELAPEPEILTQELEPLPPQTLATPQPAPKESSSPIQSIEPIKPPVATPIEQLTTAPIEPPEATESTSSLPPAPLLPPAPAPLSDEQTAARLALADAISDIRKLNPTEYNADYRALSQIIQRAEFILSDPHTTLQDIFTTASELLQAFDGLQQSDDFILSDDELDELFYHGAVLEEMVKEPQTDLTSVAPQPQIASPAEISPAAVANQLSLQVQAYDESEPIATDFSRMIDLLNLIADLDLNRYTASSQTLLLESLAETEEVLSDPTSSQEEIDDIVERITDGLQALELVRLAHLTGRSRHGARVNIPAPTVHQPIPIIMIDEMTPSANWSTGVTMIDEMAPCVVDADTLDKMIRATKPVVAAFFDTLASPLRKVSRSLAAGAKAGLAVYRETLHAAK